MVAISTCATVDRPLDFVAQPLGSMPGSSVTTRARGAVRRRRAERRVVAEPGEHAPSQRRRLVPDDNLPPGTYRSRSIRSRREDVAPIGDPLGHPGRQRQVRARRSSSPQAQERGVQLPGRRGQRSKCADDSRRRRRDVGRRTSLHRGHDAMSESSTGSLVYDEKRSVWRGTVRSQGRQGRGLRRDRSATGSALPPPRLTVDPKMPTRSCR